MSYFYVLPFRLLSFIVSYSYRHFLSYFEMDVSHSLGFVEEEIDLDFGATKF